MKLTRLAVCLSALGLLTLLSGCANLAPEYARPNLPVPVSLDGQPLAETPLSVPAWRKLVSEDRLAQTVALALENNRDLRIAALNIEKARAQYQIERAALAPAISATATGTSTLYQNAMTRKSSVGVGVSAYEVDFSGRLSNLKDAALQTFLATEATQRSVRSSLIAETSNAWLTLAANRDLLRLAQETLDSRVKTRELVRQQNSLGGTSQLTVAQAEATAESARADVARYTTLVDQARNALDLLVGTAVPEDCLPDPAGEIGDSSLALVDVPAGLSSEVLLQRPDLIAAENTLRATYANIGAARAAFFPSITLTASGGSASPLLENLFDAGTRTWTFVPTLTLPIFNAGKLRASLSVAEISRDIQVATYEKAIQTAFSEVADALAERRHLGERIAAQKAQTGAYAKSLALSMARYRSGADSFLVVLDSQRSLYSAQQTLISLQLSEQSNRISLFKVLGGE